MLMKSVCIFVLVLFLTVIFIVSNVEHVEHKKYHPWPHLRIRNKVQYVPNTTYMQFMCVFWW